jgi:hypothetical protein
MEGTKQGELRERQRGREGEGERGREGGRQGGREGKKEGEGGQGRTAQSAAHTMQVWRGAK